LVYISILLFPNSYIIPFWEFYFLPSSLTSSCHLFLGLHLSLVVPKFIYNTLLGILYSSILSHLILPSISWSTSQSCCCKIRI
jgi:hypothetical protein